MKTYPALDVSRASDLTLAAVDDFSPTAIEERGEILRIFFAASADRDAARSAIEQHFPVASVEVSDEDWARRSQAGLQAITVGRITIDPDPHRALRSAESGMRIVIPASMGFGTGHHATTRMCLEGLQTIDLTGARVLDVGTGSGILAIAASRLSALAALGVDTDEDAIHAALENLGYNPEAVGVTFEVADVTSMRGAVERVLGRADVVTANLTGALLVRSAASLLEARPSGGVVVISGVQIFERDQVVRAFAPLAIVSEHTDGEWVALVLKRS